MNKQLKVEITQVVDAQIEKVWDAWTKPENLQQWLHPERMSCPEIKADLKVGGQWHIVMEGHQMEDPTHNGIMKVGGEYLEIDPPNKLVFTWLWEGQNPETHTTTVTVLLKELTNKQTELTLIQVGFADEHMKNEHNMGWNSTFNNLLHFLN